MKFRINNIKPLELEAKNGDTRVIEKFLWFPVNIKNEIRWLETTKVIQRYEVTNHWRYENFLSQKIIRYPVGVWVDKEFADSNDPSEYSESNTIEIDSNEKPN